MDSKLEPTKQNTIFQWDLVNVPNQVVATPNKRELLWMPTGDGSTKLVDLKTATLATLGTNLHVQMTSLALKIVLLMVFQKVTGLVPMEPPQMVMS